MISLFKTLHLVTDSVWVCSCHGTHVEVRGQLSEVSALPQCGSQVLGLVAMPFPSESAQLPEKMIFNKIPKYKLAED